MPIYMITQHTYTYEYICVLYELLFGVLLLGVYWLFGRSQLAMPRHGPFGLAEISVLAVLSFVLVVVSSWSCRVSIRLFSRLPRKEGQYYTTNSPFTPVGGESTKPVLCRHTTSFSIGKPLVSMSDPFSSVWIFARTNSFSSTLSRNQWYLL